MIIRNIMFRLRMWQLSILQGCFIVVEYGLDISVAILSWLQLHTWLDHTNWFMRFLFFITEMVIFLGEAILNRMNDEIADVKSIYL